MPRILYPLAAVLTAIVVLIPDPVSGQTGNPGARPTDPDPPSDSEQSFQDREGPDRNDDVYRPAAGGHQVVCQTSRGFCQGLWPRPVTTGQACRCGDIPGQVR